MSGFDALALDRGYACLDALPATLYVPVVTCPHGSLEQRASGIMHWRGALLAGQLPEPADLCWPAPPLRDALLGELRALDVVRFCRTQPELSDALLLSILSICTKTEGSLAATLPERLAALRSEELARRLRAAQDAGRSQGRASRQKNTADPDHLLRTVVEEALARDTAAQEALREQAMQQALAELAADAVVSLHATWHDRARIWAELADVFGELGQLLSCGWDLCRGILSSQGWLEVARLRALLEHVPALKELMRTLGRMQTSSTDRDPVLERILAPLCRAQEEIQQVRSPLARSDTRGVVRSDDLARMLPSEATLLSHSRLRILWHARRAERTLLCYQVEGVLSERSLREVETIQEEIRQAPRVDRGPILLCLDTSGSMVGLPEQVAKALALEALRVAHAEKRRCYVYAFSGPGDVACHELALTPEGLGCFMAFLTLSFHGGTDVQAPLTLACERLRDEAYRRADLLIVSDGDFPPPGPAVMVALEQARSDLGLRVHGVQIGVDRSPAMETICSPLHRFHSWRSLMEDAFP